MGLYECPEKCHETGGNPPYCVLSTDSVNVEGTGGAKPCRVRDPEAKPEYRCDDVGVCILGVGTPKVQFKGVGAYFDDTCDGMCGTAGAIGQNGDTATKEKVCNSGFNCSLAGVCTSQGTCQCDPWADGADCSYLKFQPVDKSRIGYPNEHHTSWGGSIVQASDGMYHLYISEIICKSDLDTRKRCGLSGWQTHSRVAVAKSDNVDGPYHRNGMYEEEVVLHPEHHNPSFLTRDRALASVQYLGGIRAY
jgi:hypothetical protein